MVNLTHARQYHLSQNYFLFCNSGKLFIANPVDILGSQRKQIDIDMARLILRFVNPCDMDTAMRDIAVAERQKVIRFLNTLIEERILVDYDQKSDLGVIVSNMVAFIRRMSSIQQLRFANNRIKGRGRLFGITSRIKSINNCDLIIRILRGKGLEIGGDVPCISEFLPQNRLVTKLDYSSHKEDSLQRDATVLSEYSDQNFDFIISSHTLEHLSNPIKALREWQRVVKDGGFIYCVVPNKEYTSDFSRPLTTIDHLEDDYANDVPLHDLTHAGLDNSNPPWWGMDYYQPHEAPYNHMHVWNMESLLNFLESIGITVIDAWESAPYNLHVLIRVGKSPFKTTYSRTPFFMRPGLLILLFKLVLKKLMRGKNARK